MPRHHPLSRDRRVVAERPSPEAPRVRRRVRYAGVLLGGHGRVRRGQKNAVRCDVSCFGSNAKSAPRRWLLGDLHSGCGCRSPQWNHYRVPVVCWLFHCRWVGRHHSGFVVEGLGAGTGLVGMRGHERLPVPGVMVSLPRPLRGGLGRMVGDGWKVAGYMRDSGLIDRGVHLLNAFENPVFGNGVT